MGSACSRRASPGAGSSQDSTQEKAPLQPEAPPPKTEEERKKEYFDNLRNKVEEETQRRKDLAASLDEAEDVDGLAAPCPLTGTGCRNCWARKGTSICRRCNLVKYCSAQCQKDHWPVHKSLCAKGPAHLRVKWAELFQAVTQTGDLSDFRHFMRHVGPDFWYNEEGSTILHQMVNFCAVLKTLPSTRLRSRCTTFIHEALQFGADVNAKNKAGDTALHVACKDGSPEAQTLAELLLEDPSIKTDIRNNPGEDEEEGKTAEEVCANAEMRAFIKKKQEDVAETRRKKQEEEDAVARENRREVNRKRKEELDVQLAEYPRRERCRECWKPGRLICKRCNMVKYCSPECQKANWSLHQQVCGKSLGDLQALFAGTLTEAINKKDVTNLRCFVQQNGRNRSLRVELTEALWIIHGVVTLATSLGPTPKEQMKPGLASSVIDLLQDCVDFDVDLDAQAKNGNTCLHMLCQVGVMGAYAARWLLENTAVDRTIKNTDDLTALDVAHRAGMHPDKATYTVRLDKTAESMLGITLTPSTGGASPDEAKGAGSVVLEVAEDGLIGSWNASQKATGGDIVSAGDRILSANGVQDSHEAIMAECKKEGELNLTLERFFVPLLAAFDKHP